jgi:hypothetical protein
MPSNLVIAGIGAKKLGGGVASSLIIFVAIYWIVGRIRN